mmetsp:Transcript_21954/g.51465  ORF Transcript_21954/g.51465 Transcript_21954/m.51465 type:complete len:226 (+) Transcript_21954:34-711(+)
MSLEGQVICFAGSVLKGLPQLGCSTVGEGQRVLSDLVAMHGGEVSKSVSLKVNQIVCLEPVNKCFKLPAYKRAKELKLPIAGLEYLLKRVPELGGGAVADAGSGGEGGAKRKAGESDEPGETKRAREAGCSGEPLLNLEGVAVKRNGCFPKSGQLTAWFVDRGAKIEVAWTKRVTVAIRPESLAARLVELGVDKKQDVPLVTLPDNFPDVEDPQGVWVSQLAKAK